MNKMPRRFLLIWVITVLIYTLSTGYVLAGDYWNSDISSAGIKTTILNTGDPVNAATGEFYFHKKLFDLGGPLPLDFRLYYGSQYSQQTTANGLPLRFDGNHKPLLYVMDDFQDPTIRRAAISLGRGEEILASLASTDTEWQVSTVKADPYMLKETADYFYLLDPSGNVVYTFKKETPAGSFQNAYAVRIEDRNGNALTYENPENISATGPVRVYDGLGRELDFTYTAYQYTNSGNPTVYQRYYLDRIEDQAGRVWTLTYEVDEGERNYASDPPYVIKSITDPMGNVAEFTYGGLKRITDVTNPGGNIPIVNAYNTSYTSGVVQTQTDAYGNIMTLTPNLFNLSTNTETQFAVSYPDGSAGVYDHTHAGRVMKGLTDAAGKSAAFQADPEKDQVTGVTNRRGETTSFSYHPETGKLSSITNAKGDVLSYTYTPQEQTLTNSANSEQVTFTFYNLTRTDYPDGTNAQFTHDARGNMLTRKDRAGMIWTYTYNSMGQVLTITNPTGGVVTNTYNADATIATSTDTDTGTTAYTYDTYKRLQRITHPDTTYIELTYNLNDQITSIRDENNHTYTYTYDANGNLTTITDPKANQTQYAYDLMDRVAQITDRLNKNADITYDTMGRTESITDPNNIAATYEYDPRGWTNSTTIGGQTWQSGYDDEGVVSSSTTPLNNTTTYQTDKLGYITGITNPLNQTTTFTRDTMSRITDITDPLNRTSTYSHDNRGLLTGVTTPEIGTATYQRDDLGQLSQITDLNGNNWTFGYTDMGRPSSITDPLSDVTGYSYDTRGRLSQIIYADTTTMDRTYDDAGNITRRLYSDSTDLQYTYDELNRLIAANGLTLTRDAEGRVTDTINPGTSFGATYDDGGRLKTATYDNSLFTVTYTYDVTTGLLSSVTDNLTNAQIDFTYDNDRRMTWIDRSNGVNTTYTYDNAGRLTRIQDGSITDLQYTLDAAGQITSVNMTVPFDPAALLSDSTDTFTYDNASQISTSGYGYDPRGRLTASPGQNYTWDGASRLRGTDSVGLSYNGINDLVYRTEGVDVIHYYYNHAIGLKPIVGEKNDTTGQFLRYYVWTPGGQLLYMIDTSDNKAYYYHFDRTGSTLALTDASGTVTDKYAYTPYGEMIGRNGPHAQSFTFVGKWGVRQEGISSLYHMRARYYDAVTARFMSREPLWPDIAESRAINPYQYAVNDPIGRMDPQGTDVGVTWPKDEAYNELRAKGAALWKESNYESGIAGLLACQLIVALHIAGEPALDREEDKREDDIWNKEGRLQEYWDYRWNLYRHLGYAEAMLKMSNWKNMSYPDIEFVRKANRESDEKYNQGSFKPVRGLRDAY
jgi:RHS repeat-associated protein